MNDEHVDYSTLPSKDDGLTYTLPIPESRDSFQLKVIDLENERCIFDIILRAKLSHVKQIAFAIYLTGNLDGERQLCRRQSWSLRDCCGSIKD